ncbi:erythromycin esterase family protein [Kitasatospora sp. NPDC058965]|uniref:erythromycin esterase family protein n=1 Tax=Kitasatospora sp. NPDC058965 TaxID=3346682 RepID=UPI0036772530
MTRNGCGEPRSRRALLASGVAVTAALLIPATAAQGAPAAVDPGHALRPGTHPLRSTEPGTDPADLHPLGAMIGDATVVGLGEAAHGSHEFLAVKDRIFRWLVAQKGFTTFALGVGWPAGVRIDEYLQHGGGDVRQLVAETLAGSPWDREELVTLLRWMRDYNVHHPARPLHFVGDDVGFPGIGDAFFRRITDYLRRARPELSARVAALYAGLRPLDDAFALLGRPLAERQRLAADAQQAANLIAGRPGPDGPAAALAAQHARSVAQTAGYLAFDFGDPAGRAAANRFRDRAMAQNVLWWQRHSGGKVLLSAHDGHVGYLGDLPGLYPGSQGSFLRDALGAAYLPVGCTFGQGSFLARDTAGDNPAPPWQPYTVGPPGPGSNEHTLEQVRRQDFYLDLRTVAPVARAWLSSARPTRSIGTDYPCPEVSKALGHSFDVLIHLHRVRAAQPRST